jgi:hypothetical protein
MDSLLSELAAHSYSILFLAVFLETVGFPIPAALALLIAGGAARASLPSWDRRRWIGRRCRPPKACGRRRLHDRAD